MTVADYSNCSEVRGIKPVIFWLVGHDGIPIRAQGFLGAWDGRPDDYWFPAAQMTSRRPWIYETRQEAVDAALARLAEKRVRLDSLEEQIRAVESGEIE